jgi:hypothetical protein
LLPTTDCRLRAAGNTKNGYSAKRAIPVMPGQGIAKGNSLHAKRKKCTPIPFSAFHHIRQKQNDLGEETDKHDGGDERYYQRNDCLDEFFEFQTAQIAGDKKAQTDRGRVVSDGEGDYHDDSEEQRIDFQADNYRIEYRGKQNHRGGIVEETSGDKQNADDNNKDNGGVIRYV